jgi:serine/threonine protein kinase
MGSGRTPTALQDTIPADSLDRAATTAGGRRGARSTATSTTALPADLLEAAARRLSTAALVFALVFVVVFGFMRFAGDGQGNSMALANMVAGLCIAVSLAVFAAARSKLSPQRILDLGLIYEIVGAFGISLAESLATEQPDGMVRGISWVCVWIALFPLVVPSTPGKTFIVALASATMGPVALYAATFMGIPMPSLSVALLMITPNFIAAGLAVLCARVIYKLGADVRRAQELGSYQLVELLGRGGMGEVWRARHRMLAQPAAIKLVSPEVLGGSGVNNESVLKRFEREARATAMLNSQNTIQLYDYGRTADGTLYYVMELLDGVDLETLVEEHGALSSARAVFLLKQICESLDEAHASGLVHRDIKPANVYVCRLGNRHDCIKVLDFGIVAIRDEVQKGKTRLTAENSIAGTPAFMAPETISGDRDADELVDIYALGCLAYWLVTGELVFDGDSPVKILYGHVEKKPVRPSKRAGIELPHDFEQLILQCLAKDPDKRPASARELAEQLDALSLDEPWNEKQAAEWWRDRPVSSRTATQPSQRHETIVKA